MDIKRVSVVIIVKNAQDTISKCLNSIKDFGEIILLDNKSTDHTLKIAKKLQESHTHIKIYESEFIGFGPLKNLAISYASNDWIFNIDSDEILEKEALEELKTIRINQNDILGFPRKNFYNHTWIKACGWWPDRVFRIFNKKHTLFNENLVHESLIIKSDTQKIELKNSLKHFTCKQMSEMINKMNLYSSYSAEQKFYNKEKPSIIRALSRLLFVFIKDYFFRKGFAYGYKGFVIAFLNANGAFFRYMKLYDQIDKNEKN